MRPKISYSEKTPKFREAQSGTKKAELPRLQIGDEVEKFGGSYGGPGRIVSKFPVKEDEWRFIVSHKIEGGYGKLLHIYSAGQLRKLTDDRGTSHQAQTKKLRGRDR